MSKSSTLSAVFAAVLAFGLSAPLAVSAQNTASISKDERRANATFSSGEIMATGHQFFGKTSRGISSAIEYVFQSQGEPSAYIVGEEGSGALVGGLRYGEGTIYFKDGSSEKIYWQGPSIGYDFGGNGSRSMVLVYGANNAEDLHYRFGGVEGSAYLVGGLGVNFQKRGKVTLAPIRTGLGARIGANIGYLKYSAAPTWNPF
jgi:hypothetical protein